MTHKYNMQTKKEAGVSNEALAKVEEKTKMIYSNYK